MKRLEFYPISPNNAYSILQVKLLTCQIEGVESGAIKIASIRFCWLKAEIDKPSTILN